MSNTQTAENTAQSQQEKEQAYRQHVEQTTPKYSMSVRMAKAFVTGGIICVIGQGILNYAANRMGLDKETAGAWCSMLLVLLSVAFTGFGFYTKMSMPRGAATRTISLMFLHPRFFISSMAAQAEPPVASMGSTIIISRSATSLAI